MSAPLTKPRFTGARVTRLEDARLLRGQGRYLDDIDVPGMLEMAFVRSTRAAARILSIDTTAAARLPGVHAVLTGEDCAVDLPTKRFEVNQPVLARGEVRFVGEPVVAIIADSRYIAEDAADLVQIRYEALPPVLHAHAALSDSPRRVHSHRENAFALSEKVTPGFEEAFASAPHHASARFMTHRQTGAAIENRGCAAMTDPASGRLTVYCSHQSPHQFRSDLTELLGLAENLIRVVVPEVGGAFGIKAMFYPEYVVVAYAAQLLRRPVKWVSDRTESLLSDCHSRDNSIDASVAFYDEGHIIAVKATFLGDTGAYPIFGFPGAVGETGWASNMLTGPYKIPYVSLTRQHVFSNKTPVGAYRGVGGPVGAQVQEGIVELVARELSMDPADVRRVNMIQPEDFPYTTPTGNLYDPGSYGESMEQALRMIGYDEFRRAQETLRADGKYQGIGRKSVV